MVLNIPIWYIVIGIIYFMYVAYKSLNFDSILDILASILLIVPCVSFWPIGILIETILLGIKLGKEVGRERKG